ncbi:SH3 domain-containing protein [Deinococcus alpinitundrae]|uniref:SH3 domain-containing protein n=1 Tax=Deinococcus alpinitundrae TaxID=468913 RepID=UPI00137A0BBA|nr:SH3 domain-containing protein [Deinococcus alpinitundrae]
MKLMLTVALLLALAAPAGAEDVPFVFQSDAVTRHNTNLRTGPSLKAAVLTVVPRGQPVQVGRCSVWCPVKYQASGKTYAGYISADLLKRQLLPIITPQPKSDQSER